MTGTTVMRTLVSESALISNLGPAVFFLLSFRIFFFDMHTCYEMISTINFVDVFATFTQLR